MYRDKLQVRTELERIVYNYALVGKIENDLASLIIQSINMLLKELKPPPILQGNIITFPTPAIPKPTEKPRLLFSECVDIYKNMGFDNVKHISTRLWSALYRLHIHSLEELARTPPDRLRDMWGIGKKTLAEIRTVLENKGFTLSNEWNTIPLSKPQNK